MTVKPVLMRITSQVRIQPEPDSALHCAEAGEFEQARNVSQLIGTRVTVLDPAIPRPCQLWLNPTDYDGPFYYPPVNDDGTSEWLDNQRDDSTYFIVYETGDNTTVAEGEATPMDLFYSRAYEYGDEYDLVR